MGSASAGRGPAARVWIALFAALLALALSACVRDESDVPKILRRARDAVNAGLWFEAETRYEEFLRQHPGNPHRWEAWENLLNVTLSVRGDQDKAIAVMETMLVEYADEPSRMAQVLLRMGDASLAQQRPAKAVEYWRRGLGLADVPRGEIWPFTMRLGRTWRSMKEYTLSRGVLEECMDYAPDPEAAGRCRVELAMTLGFSEDWRGAASLLDTVVADARMADEDRGVAGVLLADALLHLGDALRAREVLVAARPLHPNPKAVDALLAGLERK